MQRADGFAILGQVFIEEGRTFEGSRGKKFGDAIGLSERKVSILHANLEFRVLTNFCARAARRRKAWMTVTAVISLSANCAARSSVVVSVILISSALSSFFASGRVLRALSGSVSGKAG